MKNIVKEVNNFLDKKPSIRQHMRRGLINNRALAKYILKEKKINANINTLISAIRRYELEEEDDLFAAAYKLIIQTDSINTRSRLAEISLVKDKEVQQLLPKIFNILNHDRGDVLRIIQANENRQLF